MPGLLIKDVPADLHRRIKAQAARHHRSLSRQALAILEEALRDPAGPPTLQEIDELRVRGARPLTDEILTEARRTGRP